jgi:hypothetical protein
MSRQTRQLLARMTLLPLLMAGVIAAAADAPATSAAPATAAQVQVCLDVAADLTAVYPSDTFPAGITAVSATIALEKKAGIKKVTSDWIAVDVGSVAPPNYKIASADLDANSSDRLRFRYSQPKPMPPGKYRVDVTADGKPFASASFAVAEKSDPPNLKQPAEMLPLNVGHTWTYDFVQEAAGDAKVFLDDVAPGADGKLRATVTQTVAGTDEHGVHLEMRRNDKLVFESWCKLDHAGFADTRRKSGGDAPLAIEPPQVMWPWPLKPKTWQYKPKDKSYSQKYQMWGPLPVETPDGAAAAGFVVLTEQTSAPTSMTVERYFAPGIGMTREVIITALHDQRVSRQEMTLQSVK